MAVLMKISNSLISFFMTTGLIISCGPTTLSSINNDIKEDKKDKGYKYLVVSDEEIQTEYFNSDSCLLKSDSIISTHAPIDFNIEENVVKIITVESESEDEGCHINSEFISDGMVSLSTKMLEEIKPEPVTPTKEGKLDNSQTKEHSSGLSRNMRAFLDVIAYAEGTNDKYNISFTHKKFYSFDRHPAALYCSGRLCSDAAGRYQFLSTTWQTVARSLGLYDFSPHNQDKAAVELIKRRGAYNAVEIIDGPISLEIALRKCSLEWASLPGSPYGQPIKTVSELWNVFKRSLANY
jgi:muramidase (phage lysozyme)